MNERADQSEPFPNRPSSSASYSLLHSPSFFQFRELLPRLPASLYRPAVASARRT